MICRSLILSIVVTLWLHHQSEAQTTYIANNNSGAIGGTNVFTGNNALNNAFNAASDGDIIYVIPSPNEHPNLTLDKQLSIFGIGFDPDKQAAELSMIASFGIENDNIRISGMTVRQNITFTPTGSPTGSTNNIVIDHTLFRGISGSGNNVGNVIITNCIIGNNLGTIASIATQSSYTNFTISHNLIYASTFTGQSLMTNVTGATLTHNIIIANNNGGFVAFENVDNCSIRNNIFYGVQPISNGTFSNNDISNNITFAGNDNNFPTGNGNVLTANQEGVDPLFVDLPLSLSYNFSRDPNLQPTSPGVGMADDGTDVGIFGGGSPFDLTGTPLPLVQSVVTPAMVSQGDGLDVNITGKGN